MMPRQRQSKPAMNLAEYGFLSGDMERRSTVFLLFFS